MTVKKTKDIATVLKKKGFVENSGKTRKRHTFYFLHVNGQKTNIWTKLSHGISEYDDNLLTQVRKQLKFEKKKELVEFLECPKSYEDYVEMLNDHSIDY